MNRRRGGRPVVDAGRLVSLLAAGLGWFVVSRVRAEDRRPTAAPGAVDLFSCPMDGAQSIGQLQPGDDVWLIGVSDGRWGVVRHPDDPTRPGVGAARPVRHARAHAGGLPEMGVRREPHHRHHAPPTTAPPTTIAGAPTTQQHHHQHHVAPPRTTATTIAARPHPADGDAGDQPAVPVRSAGRQVRRRGRVGGGGRRGRPHAAGDHPLDRRQLDSAGGACRRPASTPVAGNRFKLSVTANGPAAGRDARSPSRPPPPTARATSAPARSPCRCATPRSFGCT